MLFQLHAQVPTTGSYTDCNNRTESIQNVLGNGYALIIAHKGVDCSVCRSQAPGWQSWAATNANSVKVWCALTWKYNASTFSQPCIETANWVSQYSWNDIFTFPDYNREFINFATPRYYVYSPIDSTIKYSGSSSSTARSVALQESIVGIQDQQLIKDIDWKLIGSELRISQQGQFAVELRIFDLNGRILKQSRITQELQSIHLGEMDSGVYLLQFQKGNQSFTEKILFNK